MFAKIHVHCDFPAMVSSGKSGLVSPSMPTFVGLSCRKGSWNDDVLQKCAMAAGHELIVARGLVGR